MAESKRADSETYQSLELLVLNKLRIKGRATASEVASAFGLTDEASATLLRSSEASEDVEDIAGSFRLTSSGRQRLASFLDEERSSCDATEVANLYGDFEVLDGQLKQIVAAWQLRTVRGEVVPNDHSTPAYDDHVLGRLRSFDRKFQPLLSRITEILPRLARDVERFSSALERIREGDRRYVCAPGIESYHTVWWEMHEELLGLAGRKRDE